MTLPDEGKAQHRITRRLGTQSLYILLGNLFTLFVGFPLQIYVARVLGAGGLGVYALVEAGIVTLVGFISLGIPATVIRFVPPLLERHDFTNIRKLIFGGAALLLVIGWGVYVVGAACLKFLMHIWPVFEDHAALILIMGCMIPLSLIMLLLLQSLRAFQDIRYIVMGNSILQLTVKVIVVVILFTAGFRLEGYAFAVIISTFAASLWMGAGLYRRIAQLPHSSAQSDEMDVSAWRSFAGVNYSLNLLSSATAGIDRFLLGAFFGSTGVGVLVVVVQLQQMPLVFNQMLLMVGAPMLAAASAKSDRAELQHLYGLMTDWVVRASLPLMFFLVIFASPLLGIYGSNFADKGSTTLQIIMAAQFFSLICGPTGNITMMCGLEKINLRVSVVTMVLSVILMGILVPLLGLLGIGIASAAAIILQNIWFLIEIRKRLDLRWWNRRFLSWLAPAGATFIVGGAIFFLSNTLSAKNLVVSLIAMYVAFVIVTIKQGLHDDDRDLLRYIRDRILPQKARIS